VGITATASYDAARRPIGLSFGTAGSVGQSFDRDGNVTAETHTLTGVSGAAGTGTQSFTYDPLNRVTGSSGLSGLTRSYTYDLDGNRLTKTENGTTTYTATFEATDQARTIIKTGGSPLTFGYDQYGNLTSDVTDGVAAIGYGYDIAGRLLSIDAPGTTNDASFAIDAAGRFRSRTIAGVTDTYAYEGLTETVTRIINASPVDSLVDATGGRLSVKVGSTVNWFLPDPHGNVAGALSGTTVTSALRYDPYGQTIATGSAGGTPVATGHWKHQARLDISPPGLSQPLYEAGARLYSPGLGAFTSLDTLMGTTQDPLSLNRYLYALANPATLIDPTGHGVCPNDYGRNYSCTTGGDDQTELEQQQEAQNQVEQNTESSGDDGSDDDDDGFQSTPDVQSPPNGATPPVRDCGLLGLGCLLDALFGSPPCALVDGPYGQELRCAESGSADSDAVEFPGSGVGEVSNPRPPGFDPDTWQLRPATRDIDEMHWYDPEGGEWRWHEPDPWHPEGHWDYNPWDEWNSPWQNIYPDEGPPKE
jgi:RHS repeat-associated protein